MSDPQLTELAKTIGFNFVNDDLGFDVYEYTIVRKDEAVSKIVRILETPTDLERYEIISLLKSVLPFDLRWKLTKIVESVKLSSLAKMVEVLTFAVEEYKSQTDYAKLKRKVAVVPDLSVYETTDDVQVINGEEFYGQVITFMALDNIKQATWEDVVRRKGHVDYHMTSAPNGGWVIKRSGVPNPYAYAKRKDEALKLARIYAEREKAELKVHNEKGIIEKSYSYGREKLRG